MNIEQIKKEMLEYRDFYGGDIPDSDSIKNAKTKEDLRNVLHNHRSLLEDSLTDALSHLKEFEKRVGLF